MKRNHTYILLLVIAMLLGCTNVAGPGGEGNGSETTARGVIIDSTGTPAAGVPVQLLPATYNPVVHDTLSPEWSTVSNSKGEYHLRGISAGTFTIEAGLVSAATKVLVKGIEITGKKEELELDTCTLRKTGTVVVQLSSQTVHDGDYIYVPGTSSYSVIATGDRNLQQAVIQNVPAGEFNKIIHIASADSSATNLLDDTVKLDAGDTVNTSYYRWSHHRAITLNTSASGADVQGNLTNFPVLIRLDNSNFNFNEAAAGGKDLRFTDAEGKLLPHEIERWNAASHTAEIWVTVDLIRGGNSSQFIVMYWGYPDAPAVSTSSDVFATSNGFTGVWHLADSSGTIYDATAHQYNGTREGNQVRAAGYIGYGQSFDGTSDYSEIPDVANPDTSGITVSAWIKLSAIKKRQTIISKSRGGLPSVSYGWLVTLDEYGALQAFAASDTGVWGNLQSFVLTSKTTITDTTSWHHVVAIINRTGNKNCYLFIDGVDVTIATAAEITTVGSISSPNPVRIGAEGGGGYPWDGLLDECSVSYRVRSTDWVRLSYMNQRVDDKLVVFK